MLILKINGRIPKTYRLDETGVVVSTYANPKLPTEEHIKFENIRSDRFYYAQKNYQYLIVGGISFIILMLLVGQSIQEKTSFRTITIIFSIGIATSICLFLLHQPKVYFIKTFSGKFLKFKVDNNETEIDAFVKNIIERRNEYLKLKYGNPTQYLSYDTQYSNFNTMLKENMMTTDEYKEKINSLNNIFNQTAPQKSFLGYNQN